MCDFSRSCRTLSHVTQHCVTSKWRHMMTGLLSQQEEKAITWRSRNRTLQQSDACASGHDDQRRWRRRCWCCGAERADLPEAAAAADVTSLLPLLQERGKCCTSWSCMHAVGRQCFCACSFCTMHHVARVQGRNVTKVVCVCVALGASRGSLQRHEAE